MASRSTSSSSIFSSPSCTRLVSIVAHVDHGKTSLADSLVEYNGIISERLAGTMRFLDSLEEEQRRGITIKSSAIALKHWYTPPPSSNSTKTFTDMNMVIHILDSPGHVDFCHEVTSSLQICDGAVLLVDVVEGMCARTHSILREAYSMNLTPILVLNKLDRLCLDLKLTPNEAYLRIRHVIESVNAAASNIIRSANADLSSISNNTTNQEEESCEGS
jgi:ribosome assembly protein 1